MIFRKNTADWHWIYPELIELEMENTKVDEGFELKSMDDVVNYLADFSFFNDFVAYGSIQEVVYNVCTELGCVYEDIHELESDIRKYYI